MMNPLSDGFSLRISEKDKVSEILYSFIANGYKYWAIVFELSHKLEQVWSISERSFKSLIFIWLISVDLCLRSSKKSSWLTCRSHFFVFFMLHEIPIDKVLKRF